jgi:hypothetical protein
MDEPPHVSSTLRWDEVALPPAVTVADLDTLIISSLTQNWLKTARIIGDVVHAFGNRSTPLDAEVVGARIVALVKAGQIDVQGSPSMWRHSELRLPGMKDR